MSNITIASFKTNRTSAVAHYLWQWDYGQKLQIHGITLPSVVEINFSLTEHGGEAITRIGTTIDSVTEVAIPDAMLENNGLKTDYTIYAYCYLADTNSGQTEYSITIPVRARSMPDIQSKPQEEQDIFRQTINAVGELVDSAVDYVHEAEAWAHGGIEAFPDCEEDNAKYWAEYAERQAGMIDEDTRTVIANMEDLEELRDAVQQNARQVASNAQTVGAQAARVAQQSQQTQTAYEGMQQIAESDGYIQAKKYAQQAESAADRAEDVTSQVINYKESAGTYTIMAKSWAVGGTSSRANEEENNAKYYAQRAQYHSINANQSYDRARTAQINAEAAAARAEAALQEIINRMG